MRICMLLVVAVLIAAAPAAQSAVLWDQQPNVGTGNVAQDFPDQPGYSTWEFDDFVVGGSGWVVNKVTVFGREEGYAAANVMVSLGFTSVADRSAIGTVYSGTQIGEDLVFDSLNVALAPGNYWVTAWVTRPINGGGQWYWDRSLPVNGSEQVFHNPGGSFGYGTAPVSSTVVFGQAVDLAFAIEGRAQGEPAIPEASSVLLALSALPALAAAARLRRGR